MVGGIKSEWWAPSSRNGGRDHPGIRILIELVSTPGKPDVLRDRCEAALVKAHLKPDSIKTSFLKPFGKKAKAP
jgi:hypothetical protein